MKKIGLIFATLALFAASVYLAFMQGASQQGAELFSAAPSLSPVVYTGLRAYVANYSAWAVNGLMGITGQNILLSLIALALFVELVLLYPSVRVQLKQKKIHLFHKKLVDRFNRGELSVSDTQHELHKLYAVNEKMHSRGAILVALQVVVFLMVLWGLNLLANTPSLVQGSWSVFDFSLLSRPANFAVPLLAALLYFLHSLAKIYYKEREDYIGPTQSVVAVAFAVVGSTAVYFFAGTFAIALTLYFVTLITFATLRYAVVERNARAWGSFAQRSLIEDLRHAQLHKDKFQYLSYRWNHLPLVRHINFHLLEEAVSMSLGLMLAMNVMGAFQVGNNTDGNLFAIVPTANADLPAGFVACDVSEQDPMCPQVVRSPYDAPLPPISQLRYFRLPPDNITQIVWFYSDASHLPISFERVKQLFPTSCCVDYAGGKHQIVLSPTAVDSASGLGCDVEELADCSECLAADGCDQDMCENTLHCTWQSNACTGGPRYCFYCSYKWLNSQIGDLGMTMNNGPCDGDLPIGQTAAQSPEFKATGGSGFYEWVVSEGGQYSPANCDGTAAHKCDLVNAGSTKVGPATIEAHDYYNSQNKFVCSLNFTYGPLTGATCRGRGLAYGTKDGGNLAKYRTTGASGTGFTNHFVAAGGDPADVKWTLGTGSLGSITPDGAYTLDAEKAKPGDSVKLKVDSNNSSKECTFTLDPILFGTIKNPHFTVDGKEYQLEYTEGPPADHVKWEKVSGPGQLTPSGVYTSSNKAEDVTQSVTVKVSDLLIPTNPPQTYTIAPTAPTCNPNFGIYDYSGNVLADMQSTSQTVAIKDVYGKAVYRFFVKNSVVPNGFEYQLLAEVTDQNGVTFTSSPDIVTKDALGEGYFDFVFSNDANKITDPPKGVVVMIEDKAMKEYSKNCPPSAPCPGFCGTGIYLQLKGGAVKNNGPTVINLGAG